MIKGVLTLIALTGAIILLHNSFGTKTTKTTILTETVKPKLNDCVYLKPEKYNTKIVYKVITYTDIKNSKTTFKIKLDNNSDKDITFKKLLFKVKVIHVIFNRYFSTEEITVKAGEKNKEVVANMQLPSVIPSGTYSVDISLFNDNKADLYGCKNVDVVFN